MPRRLSYRLLRWLLFATLLFGLIASVPTVTAQFSQDGWNPEIETCGSPAGFARQEFVSGPGIPIYGSGSLSLTIASVNEGRIWSQLRQTADVVGLPLSSLTEVRYWTWTTEGAPRAAHLLLDVDLNDDGIADDRLIFQPELNGTVTLLTWQEWDALSGRWWSQRGLGGLPQSAPGPLTTYSRAFPQAKLAPPLEQQGALAVAVGCVGDGWAGWRGAVDALLFRARSLSLFWDFEATGVVTTRGGGVTAGPTFTALTPEPWKTIAPGLITIQAKARSDVGIQVVQLWLNDQELRPTLSGPDTEKTVTLSRQLADGVYRVRMTARDTWGRTFTTQWQFVVSPNPNDTWWFAADGKPRRAQIEQSLRTLSEAFRWHLYGISWDGSFHPEMPTHANVASTLRFTARTPESFATLPSGQAVTLSLAVESRGTPLSALEVLLNGQPLNLTLTQLDQWHWRSTTSLNLPSGLYGVTATARDTAGRTLTMAWGFVVSVNPNESPWFNPDGTMKPAAVQRTLQQLVEVFRWHLKGISWDGNPHPEVPTHTEQFFGPIPLRQWFDSQGRPNPEAISAELRSLEEAFRWHFWGISWDGNRHLDIPTHAQ